LIIIYGVYLWLQPRTTAAQNQSRHCGIASAYGSIPGLLILASTPLV